SRGRHQPGTGDDVRLPRGSPRGPGGRSVHRRHGHDRHPPGQGEPGMSRHPASRRSIARAIVCLLGALLTFGACAQAPARLEVIVFAGGFNWPIWVAQDKGYFRDNGVEVNLTPTPGSVFQMVNLIDGKFDIAMTAIDNLIAYREGEGEDPKVGPDLV